MKGGGSGKRKSIITSDLEENNDDVSNTYEDEDEEEEDEEYVEEEEEEDDDVANEDEEEEKPKLAEGYFEIESVRKKRSRKGKIQYLIKWRGWPETANTWEPFENLVSCSDIIDAFEDSMKSGKKGSSKKQKRKNEVAIQPPPVKKKKKQQQQQQQQQGSPAATYDVPSVKVKVIEEPLSRPPVNNPTCSKWAESNTKGTGSLKRLKRLSDKGPKVVSRQAGEMNEANELNVKLSELKGATFTDKGKTDELDVHIQDRWGEAVNPSNGNSNVNGQISVWRSGERVSPSNGFSDMNGQNSVWRSVEGVSPSNVISNMNGQNSVWRSVEGVSPSNVISNVNGQNSVWRSGEGVSPSNVNGQNSVWRSVEGVSPSNVNGQNSVCRSGEGVSPSNVNGQNSVWACRSGGAKRRKSGAVKRFKQDSKPVVTNNTHDAIERIASANGIVLDHGIQNFDQVGNGFGSTNTIDTSRSMYAITKIIKPIEYTTSTLNELQDILVTFLVLRSDGKEVMVDNRYLKANYPLLLIDFYEQHIQYANES